MCNVSCDVKCVEKNREGGCLILNRLVRGSLIRLTTEQRVEDSDRALARAEQPDRTYRVHKP